MPLATIPSPSQGVWHLFGVIPIRAYALCIVLGVIVAVWLGERRWRARGGQPGTITDLAVWAVPFGLVGGRLYHVISDWQLYFGADAVHRPIEALYIWQGGLGIWGAIALGGVGVWIGCRRRGISLSAVADTVAPGIALGQAIGRWGNWFNQELFGGPLNTWWALRIDPGRPGTVPGQETYHPTFLYESIWNVGVALLVIWAGKRFHLRHGRAFALYVAAYTLGRAWIEALRVDPANEILGLRLNVWTALLVFIGAIIYFIVAAGRTTPESLGADAGGGAGDDPEAPRDTPPGDETTDTAETDTAETDAAKPGAGEADTAGTGAPGTERAPAGEAGEDAGKPGEGQAGEETGAGDGGGGAARAVPAPDK
ncbi:prolipoprotein diacylglyceryl transferase [Bailinhaonella thermotolerans]|uniref:Phosphatidylglycerol--prolipoprotein diacylglyceryl transferase n=1 Tax=Bailinhaonella thermotolerans TaxID=1070861 RepID=A0A3A4AGA0_9ACTN|nr:prolipoprotein diacylglyceryl transferase [Bailinhaonella thermotolerans]RJL24693.1 prolipoprotein diacylglyceryl transferase [Bailinhaonella thermotolerans]